MSKRACLLPCPHIPTKTEEEQLVVEALGLKESHDVTDQKRREELLTNARACVYTTRNREVLRRHVDMNHKSLRGISFTTMCVEEKHTHKMKSALNNHYGSGGTYHIEAKQNS